MHLGTFYKQLMYYLPITFEGVSKQCLVINLQQEIYWLKELSKQYLELLFYFGQ